jgi:hypothetical protein
VLCFVILTVAWRWGVTDRHDFNEGLCNVTIRRNHPSAFTPEIKFGYGEIGAVLEYESAHSTADCWLNKVSF